MIIMLKHADEYYMTTTEAGARLGLKWRTIAAQIKKGRIVATKFGRDWMVSEADLQDYDILRSREGN